MNNVFVQLANYALYLFFPLVLIPFFVVSSVYKTFPTFRFALCLAIPAALWFVVFLFDLPAGQSGVITVLDLAFIAICAFDLYTVVRAGQDVTFTREAERIASLGSSTDVTIKVENRSKRSVTLEFTDDSSTESRALPPLTEASLLSSEPEEVNANGLASYIFERRTIAPNESESVSYRLQWVRRGAFSFEFIAARFWSKLGFWRKNVNYPCKTTFQVYPNLCQLTQFDALGRSNALFLLGVRRIRRVGQDDDFERLRDYTRDDQYKFIDWKATARRNKLIVRDFQDTRNQRVIIALDAGRMMTNRSGDGSNLYDAALNASLALAYIALKQGDEVGLLIFSNEVKRFIPPRGGISQMNALIRGAFDIFPERVESRYDRAFEYLAKNSPKRALVVLATNVLDERNAMLVEEALIDLSGAHLPLGVFLRERALYDAIERYEKQTASNVEELPNEVKKNRLALWIERFGDAREPLDEIERLLWKDSVSENLSKTQMFYRAGFAANILNWRKKTLRALEVKGALTLDVFPEDVAAPLVNKYLEIKARRLL